MIVRMFLPVKFGFATPYASLVVDPTPYAILPTFYSLLPAPLPPPLGFPIMPLSHQSTPSKREAYHGRA